MAESIELQIAYLIQQAIQENRQDVLFALRNISPVTELADLLSKKLGQNDFFTDEWRDLLTRTTYGLKEGRSLAAKEIMKNSEYKEFLIERVISLTDRESANHLINGLMSAGFHSAVRAVLSRDEDILSFKTYFQNHLAEITPHHKFFFYTETGQDSSITRDTISLLDDLDLDFPSNFTATDYPRFPYGGPWSSDRIEMNIELVGTVINELALSTPELIGVSGGGYKWADSSLPAAVIFENQRVQRLGGWHKENFPKYLPVIVPELSIGDMLSMGAIPVKPKMAHEFISKRTTGENSVNPSRAFVPINATEGVSDKDMRLAFSFLPPQLITGLIKSDRKTLFIIPLQALTTLASVQKEIPAPLKMAMRFHRPELLISDEHQVVYNCTSSHPLELYLKGFEIRDAEYSTLDINNHLSGRLDFLSSLLPAEAEMLSDHYAINKVSNRDFNRYRIYENVNLTVAENVLLARKSIKAISDAIGFNPAVLFKGSPEFIKGLAAAKVYSADRSVFTNIQHMNPGWYQSAEAIRCGGTIGETGQWGEFSDIPFSELVTKGTRLKVPSDGFNKQRQIILGILDRYPLEEVVATAKTKAQFKFLMDNFDLMPVREMLPKNLGLHVAGKQFSDELGM